MENNSTTLNVTAEYFLVQGKHRSASSCTHLHGDCTDLSTPRTRTCYKYKCPNPAQPCNNYHHTDQ